MFGGLSIGVNLMLGTAGGEAAAISYEVTVAADTTPAAGNGITANGGRGVVWDLGIVPGEYAGAEDGDVIYEFVRNGTPTGLFFFGDEDAPVPAVIPVVFLPGDTLTIRDYYGVESNPLTIV